MNIDKLLDFEKYWNSEENSELRRSCAKGWALRVWQASRESIEVELPESASLHNSEVIKAVGLHILKQGYRVKP